MKSFWQAKCLVLCGTYSLKPWRPHLKNTVEQTPENVGTFTSPSARLTTNLYLPRFISSRNQVYRISKGECL